jgi:hypothetical protein
LKRLVVICDPNDKNQLVLAAEIQELLKKKRPGTEFVLVTKLTQWFKAFFLTRTSRRHQALLDLAAETRNAFAFALWLPDILTAFQWRVAHAPKGELGKTRAKAYNAINWGCHEEKKKGFNVPEREYVKQLGRWLGLDL